MKKLLALLLGIIAIAGTGCEQHSAEELRGAHGEHAEPAGVQEPKLHTHPNPAPFTPDAVPQNPAGAGPVGEFEQAKPNPKEQGSAPKFFPKN